MVTVGNHSAPLMMMMMMMMMMIGGLGDMMVMK